MDVSENVDSPTNSQHEYPEDVDKAMDLGGTLFSDKPSAGFIVTLLLFNIAMENGPFIDDFPS